MNVKEKATHEGATLKNHLNDTTEERVLSILSNMLQDRKTLALLLGIEDRKLRKVIKDLRDKGLPICTDPDGGYYIGSRKEGLIEARKLRHRAYELLKTAERMEGYDPDQVKWEDI